MPHAVYFIGGCNMRLAMLDPVFHEGADRMTKYVMFSLACTITLLTGAAIADTAPQVTSAKTMAAQSFKNYPKEWRHYTRVMYPQPRTLYDVPVQ